MKLLAELGNFLTGGVADKAIELAKEYFPPDMSPEAVAELELRMKALDHERMKEIHRALAQAEVALNERIAQHEGTAKDLKGIPVLGPLMLFARGSQRPLWGFATMYFDVMVFSNQWDVSDPQLMSALWVINLLVLGFLFGERAITNIAPVLERVVGVKLGK